MTDIFKPLAIQSGCKPFTLAIHRINIPSGRPVILSLDESCGKIQTTTTDDKKTFLSQLGLVDKTTAAKSIQDAREVKRFHQKKTNALVKRMLKRKPRFCIENGKVKLITLTKRKTKSHKTDSRKIRKRPKSHEVYFVPRNKNKSAENRRNQSISSISCPRSHLKRKSVVGLGLNARSKKLLDSCRPVSIQVHRMSGEEITNTILQVKHKVHERRIVVPVVTSDKYKSINLSLNQKTLTRNTLPMHTGNFPLFRKCPPSG